MRVRCRDMHKSLIGLCFVALLAGCSGNTYGTGVTAEKQLVDDIGNMITLDMAREKKKIAYDSRPNLVKPPEVAQLPAPAEKVQAESAYFPEDPEIKRQRLLADLEEARASGRSVELSPELQQLRQASLTRSKVDINRKKLNNDEDSYECIPCEVEARKEEDKKILERRTKERLQAATKRRRYLTEPPSEYQAPAETAAVGELGENELSEAQLDKLKRSKNEKSWLKRIFGG